MPVTTREFLEEATLTAKEAIDRFLDPNAHNRWAFDAELGYRPRNNVAKDGVDGCYTISSFHSSGERRMLNFAHQQCRMNTYGDSFTQCSQTSDGETWQEYLAAHFGEPVRNLGVGGYGVYQAYRRMVREERGTSPAEYIILNIWSDDHFRSLHRWRWLHVARPTPPQGSLSENVLWSIFGTMPWAHLRLNPETGEFEECENPYSTPESRYQLCDRDHVVAAFKDSFAVQVVLAQQGVADTDLGILRRAADALEMPTDFDSPEATAETARALLQQAALRSSMYTVDKARTFAEAEGKRLMILLSYSAQDVICACRSLPRFDQVFIDYLTENDILFVDVLESHVEDFALFGCFPREYTNRYYVGHYNPRGNHFFAFAVKDAIVEWLDPNPPTYREGGPAPQDPFAALA
jgi:hypothetical protein